MKLLVADCLMLVLAAGCWTSAGAGQHQLKPKLKARNQYQH